MSRPLYRGCPFSEGPLLEVLLYEPEFYILAVKFAPYVDHMYIGSKLKVKRFQSLVQ